MLLHSGTQLYILAISGLIPLVTYVLNHYAPWVSQPVKGFVLVVTSAFAAGVYQAIDVGNVGFNAETLQFVLTAIVGAFAAHNWLYRPAGINAKLGGGSNSQDK